MNRRGVTLIELMIALVISATLIAAIYRTLLTQQSTHKVQENVADMQQNVRVGLNEMMREIRMAGFGNIQAIMPVTIDGRTYTNVINPDVPSAGALTILGIDGSSTLTGINPFPNQNQITVNSRFEGSKRLFDPEDRKYISIAGCESYAITGIVGNTLTLDRNVTTSFRTDGTSNGPTKVFAIRAISFAVLPDLKVVLPDGSHPPALKRNGNLGGGYMPLADNIENVIFQYLDGNGNPTANPPDFRSIRIIVTARTEDKDPKLKAGGGDGYRRRQVASNILLRNMGL